MPQSISPPSPPRPGHSAAEPHIGFWKAAQHCSVAPHTPQACCCRECQHRTLLGQGCPADPSPSACLNFQPVILLRLQEPSSTQPYLSRLPLTQASMWQPPPARGGPQPPQQAPLAAGAATAEDLGTTSSASQGAGSSRRATSQGADSSGRVGPDLQQQALQAAGLATAQGSGTTQAAGSSHHAASQGKQNLDRAYKDVLALTADAFLAFACPACQA